MKAKSDSKNYVRLDRQLVEEISSFLFAIGNQFVKIKNSSGAFDCFKYSVNLNPKNQSAVHNLGALYSVMGDAEGAYRMYKEAVRMAPQDIMAKIALGEISRRLGKTEEAELILKEVYGLEPDNFLVMSAMAILHYDNGRLAEALSWNEKVLDIRPGDLHCILNKTLINMTYGKWPDNWNKYEFCLSYNKNERMRNLSMADAWGGQDMSGKKLIVVSDQGSGDAIQFSRYLAEAKALGKFSKLIYLVQPDLKEVMERVDGVDEVVGFGEKMRVDYDAYSSLLGIMRVLQISPENCYRDPHIRSNPQLDEVWKARITNLWDGKSKKIAIVWAGDPKHGNDHARSIHISHFIKLLNSSSNCQFFSFQVGSKSYQISANIVDGKEIIDVGSDFRNFDDTISALKEMDLLITCDTSIGHLGGCMGVNTWILVPNPPEWRWMNDANSTSWYNSVKIFRQSKPRNWETVFGAVTQELISFCSTK